MEPLATAGNEEAPDQKDWSGASFAWRRQGSNLGRLSRQIYSLLPLATRAHRLERRVGSPLVSSLATT